MHPKLKPTRSLSPFHHHRKHRVRQGLADVLGVLGLRSDDDGGEGGSIGTPSFTLQPAEDDTDALSSRSTSTAADMAVVSIVDKKTITNGASTLHPSTIPHQKTVEVTNGIPKRQLSPKLELDRMSVGSTPSTLIPETTYTPEDSLGGFTKAKVQVSSKTSRSEDAHQVKVLNSTFSTMKTRLQEELKTMNNEGTANGLSIEAFSSYIGSERLRRMPPKGSRWDKILKWAEYFATSLSLFEEIVDAFVVLSKDTVELIFAAIRVLLQMGPSQGIAIERAFSIFHQFGLVFTFYIRNYGILREIAETRQEMGLALADMLTLIVEVTVHYHKSVRIMSSNSVTVDFNIQFGSLMDSFIRHRDNIISIMWMHQLRNSSEIHHIHVSIERIRQWLLPQDRILQKLSPICRGTQTIRAEFTCEWFERPLREFLRSKDFTMSITAETGTGKSVLSGWILERLQRPVDRTQYHTIQCALSNDTPAQATQVSLVKELLLQLLEQNVGNVALYRCLANIIELDSNTTNTKDAEDALWYVLGTALEPCHDMVLVVDGLDALQGGEVQKLEVFSKLYDMAIKHKSVRVIVLKKPSSTAYPKPTRQISIQTDRTMQDVKHLTHAYLQANGLNDDANASELAEQVAKCSKGSLTWAEAALGLLRREKSSLDMLNSLKQIPQTVKGVLEKHLSTVSLQGEASLIFAWLLVTERPLTTAEVQILLELNVQKGCHQPRSTNISDDIQRICGSLVTVQDRIVRLRNESIRLHLLNISNEGKQLMIPAEAHRDLATRLLLYNKVCVSNNMEASMDTLEPSIVAKLFESNALLEYSVRNWIGHFQRSPLCVDGQIQTLTPEMNNAFPSSTLLSLLERSCWDKQALMSGVNKMHILALKLRQNALGEKQQCVLQSLINVAHSFQALSASAEASKFYYQASLISQAVFGKANKLAVACAVAAVDSSLNIQSKGHSEHVTRQEEMIKFVIDSEKQTNGASNTAITKYNNMLAQLYSDIGENEKAEAIYRDIYNITIAQHGQFSSEATVASQKLKTVLYKEDKHEDVVKYTQLIFESAEKNLEVFDIRRVEITLSMAKTYEETGDLIRAEELYITQWRGLAEFCRAHKTSEAHERKIQVSIAYARYLKNHKRKAEAENILRGVWLDYQQRGNKSEALIGQLKLVGVELKAMGILDVAIDVFKSIWGCLRTSGRQNSAEAVSTAVALLDTVQQKSRKREEVRNAKVAAANPAEVDEEEEESDEEAEKIMDEVLEAAIAGPAVSASAGVADVNDASLETYESLSTFYIHEKRWPEALKVCQKILSRLWPTLGTKRRTAPCPTEQTLDSIRLARRLASCFFECNQTDRAETIHIQVFKAVCSAFRIQDPLLTETSNDLIHFYQRTKQYTKAIEVYEQLSESYRTALGPRNPLTIKTLYTMADLCVEYRLKDADRYYSEVVNTLKDDLGILSQDSMRAAQALSKIYYEQKHWTEARTIYTSLWITFTKRAKDYSISAEIAQSIYKRYITVLQTHLKVDFEVVRQVASEYRATTVQAYGAESAIATLASLQLADVCNQSTQYQREAIAICEQVVTKMEGLGDKVNTTEHLGILARAKRQLASLYSTTTILKSAETNDKAISLWKEQFEINRKEKGISHEATLASLASLVTTYSQSGKVEQQAAAQEQLQTASVEVLTTEEDSSKLLSAAISIARTYIACGLAQNAWSMLKELRYQSIWKDARTNDKSTVKLPKNVGRRVLVFVASFEEALRKKEQPGISFSDVMTDLLTESILYDRCSLTLNDKKASIEAKLFDGARLYVFLKSMDNHTEQTHALETSLFELFMTKAGSGIKTLPEAARMFFIAIVEELGKSTQSEDISVVATSAVTRKVYTLLEVERFTEAYEVSLSLFQFMASRQAFKDSRNIASSFKLSLYLAGLAAKKSVDSEVHNKMVDLSKAVLRETLTACKSLHIDLVQLQATELNSLVRLMGEQRNYEDLEWLLTQLWNSRQLQASWSATTVISVGRLLVEVLFCRNKHDAAITMCESICYNLRRTWGLLDQVTIDMCNLLSSLYVAAGRYEDAMAIHEEIIRTEIDGDPEEQVAERLASELMLQQLELMKHIYARQGGWLEYANHAELVNRVIDESSDEPQWMNIESVDNWSTKAPPEHDTFGTFVPPSIWEFTETEQSKKPSYLLRWLQLNRELSFKDLAVQAGKEQLQANGHAKKNGSI